MNFNTLSKLLLSCLIVLVGMTTIRAKDTPSDVRTVSAFDAVHVSHEDLPWVDFGGGINLKFPVTDPTTGMYTVVLKSLGGDKVNKHRHFGTVYGITLEGAWYYKEHDFLAKKGDFVWETPGSVHTLMTSDDYEENLVFFVVYGALEFLDDEDQTIVLFDWMAAANMQYQACAAAGIECPDLTHPRGTVMTCESKDCATASKK